MKCSKSEASAENLPGGFLNALALISFSEVSSVSPPVGFLIVASSVASAAFTAAVRDSELSVASKESASGASAAFAAAVQASVHYSRRLRREGPGLVTLDKHTEMGFVPCVPELHEQNVEVMQFNSSHLGCVVFSSLL